MKKRYDVEVDCANCSGKMETAARKVDGVEDITITFMTQKMAVTYAEGADERKVLANIVSVCKKVDSDFEVR